MLVMLTLACQPFRHASCCVSGPVFDQLGEFRALCEKALLENCTGGVVDHLKLAGIPRFVLESGVNSGIPAKFR